MGGMSSKTVRIVSSGSCLVREFWRPAAKRTLTGHLLYIQSRNAYVTSFPVPVGMYWLSDASSYDKRCVKET